MKIALKHSELNPDLQFIEEAAMTHDIGIFMTMRLISTALVTIHIWRMVTLAVSF